MIPLMHLNVLTLLLGVPAAAVLLVYLAVTLVKRRRDANWADEATLEINTEEEKAAEEEYNRNAEDEAFFKDVRVEAALQKLPSFDTEYLSTVVFSTEDYPTDEDRARLLRELHKKNPHVRGLQYVSGGVKATFGQVPSSPDPEPRCQHGYRPDDCVHCHMCEDSSCTWGPRCAGFNKKVDRETALKELEETLRFREERVVKQELELAVAQNTDKEQRIRALYEGMSDERLTKTILCLSKVGSADNAPAHLAAAKAVLEERAMQAPELSIVVSPKPARKPRRKKALKPRAQATKRAAKRRRK